MTISPSKQAIQLVKLWRHLFPDEPTIDVARFALEWSRQVRPADPIAHVEGKVPNGLEGGLFPLPSGGWAILYNPRGTPGRANFTITHELGHFALHSSRERRAIECSVSATFGQVDHTAYAAREREANEFAATLLMPADDFRAQISDAPLSLESLGRCSERYRVSLTAAALRAMVLSDASAAVVASVDGFILWSSRSTTSPRPLAGRLARGVPVPSGSGASQNYVGWTHEEQRRGRHVGDAWLDNYPCTEMGMFSDQFDLVLSLLVFDRQGPTHEEDDVEDVVDRFRARRAGD